MKTLTLEPGRYRITISGMEDYENIVDEIEILKGQVFNKDYTNQLVMKSVTHNINELPHGQYKLSVTKNGFNSIERTITIPDDIESIKTLQLSK